MDPIEFPDIELVVVEYLRAELPGVAAMTKLPTAPAERPSEFILVTRTGGPRATIVSDRPQVTIEAWSSTKPAAHNLAARARTALNALAGTHEHGATIYRVDEAAGPQYLPDPTSAQDRYTFTGTLHVRGTKVTP